MIFLDLKVNLHFFIRRLLGRPTCVMEPQSTLAWSAKILNAGQHSSGIRIGRNSRIEGELFVFPNGGQIRIGHWCFIGPGARIWSATDITIKDRVLISHNVNIFDSLTHPIDPIQRHKQFVEISTRGHPNDIDLGGRPIAIEEDAWIGAGAMIMRGVRIGARSIVGAGAVVTRDVPADVIVVGNPARIVRRINKNDESIDGKRF
jgi:acetyltransferase-like isoleucine patch superfamily enzyme